MRRRGRLGWWLAALLALGAVGGCSGGDDAVAAASVAAAGEAMDLAADSLSASGATSLGGVGGDGRSESTASTTLPQGSTVGVFAVCTGSGTVGLDLAGTRQAVECDGVVRQLDDLVLPDDELAVFRVAEPTDEPSAWGLAFAQVEGGPTP